MATRVPKFAFTADWHIGVQSHGIPDPETGINSRLLEVEVVLNSIVEYCELRGIGVLVVGGDIFHKNVPQEYDRAVFARFLNNISAKGVDCLIIIGNHDYNGQLGKKHALYSFQQMNIPGIHIYDEPGLFVSDRVGCNFFMVPYGSPVDLPDLSHDANLEYKNMVVMHTHFAGAKMGSEPFVIPGGEKIPDNIKVNMILTGHIHKPQLVAINPVTVYPGSIMNIDFNERNDVKGMVTVRPDKLPNYEFTQLNPRRFVQIDIDYVDKGEIPTRAKGMLKKLFAEYEVRDAIVKVNIKIARTNLFKLRESDVRAVLMDKGAHNVSVVNIEVETWEKERRQSIESEVTSADAFMSFMGIHKCERKVEVVERGMQMIGGQSVK